MHIRWPMWCLFPSGNCREDPCIFIFPCSLYSLSREKELSTAPRGGQPVSTVQSSITVQGSTGKESGQWTRPTPSLPVQNQRLAGSWSWCQCPWDYWWGSHQDQLQCLQLWDLHWNAATPQQSESHCGCYHWYVRPYMCCVSPNNCTSFSTTTALCPISQPAVYPPTSQPLGMYV